MNGLWERVRDYLFDVSGLALSVFEIQKEKQNRYIQSLRDVAQMQLSCFFFIITSIAFVLPYNSLLFLPLVYFLFSSISGWSIFH